MVMKNLDCKEIIGKEENSRELKESTPKPGVLTNESYSMDKIPQLLSTEEVAEKLGVTPKTVRSLQFNGLLPTKVGRVNRYHPDMVLNFIKNQTMSDHEKTKSDLNKYIPYPGAKDNRRNEQ